MTKVLEVTETTTNQEIFDHVATHLITQGQQSKAEGSSSCLYRAPLGLMCAAGCVIPDSVYDSNLERCSVMRLMGRVNYPNESDSHSPLSPYQRQYLLRLTPHQDLLSALQQIHDLDGYGDHGRPPELLAYWKRRLIDVAYKFKLESAHLEVLK